MNLLEQRDPSLQDGVPFHDGIPSTRPRSGISPREREILALGAQGLSDKEIVDRLGIAMPTLRTLWSRVRSKLGAANRTHAIVLGAHQGSLQTQQAPTVRRVADETCRGKVASWVWQGRRREVLLDDVARGVFCLPAGDGPIPVEKVLTHVWAPDRGRLERFLSQAGDLRPMTPIELRVGTPGEYANLIRAVNLVCQTGVEGSVVVFASTVLHVFPA